MSGPKRNADSLNIIGIVVVGITSAVMVYVSITALQAFYMNDTSEIQTMADYGGQDGLARSHKAEEIGNITEAKMGTQSISIDKAMDLVVRDADAAAKAGKPANFLVPGACESKHPTEKAQPGRPVLDTTLSGGCKGGKVAAPPATNAANGSGDTGAMNGSGSGTGSDSGSGSGATNGKAGKGAGSGDNGSNIHTHSTGSPADTHAVGGAGGGATTGKSAGSAALAPGGHAP